MRRARRRQSRSFPCRNDQESLMTTDIDSATPPDAAQVKLQQGRFLADRHMPDGYVIRNVGCVHEADYDQLARQHAALTAERDALKVRVGAAHDILKQVSE